MRPSPPCRRAARSLGAVLGLALLGLPGSTSAQEVTLIHEAGDRIRVGGTPVRTFAAGLRMEATSGGDIVFPDVCFVAVVDSEGQVWEEYVSQPFRSREGETDGACVPRLPMLPTGAFPEQASLVPVEEPVGIEAFFGGVPDWEFIMKRIDQTSPRVEEAFLKIDDIPGESVEPPPHVEGSEYRYVAMLFLAGPSEGEEFISQPGQPMFGSRPVLVLLDAR